MLSRENMLLDFYNRIMNHKFNVMTTKNVIYTVINVKTCTCSVSLDK